MSLAQTSMVLFKNKDFSVKRRFSDFLGLHSKLASKYLHVGYIVPPAPEKSIVGKRQHLDPEHPVLVRLPQQTCVRLVCLRLSFLLFILRRNDQSEGGEGRPVLQRVCGEEEVGPGEVG